MTTGRQRRVELDHELEMLDGKYRVRFENSMMYNQAGDQIVTGPWCTNEAEAVRWWDRSDTAKAMRGESLPPPARSRP